MNVTDELSLSLSLSILTSEMVSTRHRSIRRRRSMITKQGSKDEISKSHMIIK